MRYLRLGLLALGAGLLIMLIKDNDPAAVFASISQLSWRLLIVLCFPMILVAACDTLGWRFAFSRDRVAFPTLVSARLAGEAINLTTPTATVAGEAVKAWLLRGRVPLEESLPSLIVAKTTIIVAQGVFLLVGLVLAGLALPPRTPLLAGMQWALLVEVIVLTVFVAAQVRGILGWSARLLDRFWPMGGLSHGDALHRADAALGHFYRREPGRLLLSIFWHLMAWLLGAVETFLILHFVGWPVSLTTATVIEAFTTAIRLATFLVPASLGVLEGGVIVVFAALGLAPSAGLSLALVRRMREATWVAVGLIVFAVMRPIAGTRRGPSLAG
jgi:putative membrane protein